MRPSARAVRLNDGKAGLTGHRPASSQIPKKSANDAPIQMARRAARSFTLASRPHARQRCLERREVPEIGRLHALALDLARQREELDVVGRRALPAAVRREDAALNALLVVGQDLALHLVRQVLQEPEPLALLDREGGV